jgi:hypothetical protein
MDPISLLLYRASVGERRRGRRAIYGHALLDELEKRWATDRAGCDELLAELDLVLGAACPEWRDPFPQPSRVCR